MEAASTSTTLPNNVDDNTNQHHHNYHRSADSSDNTVNRGGSDRGTSNGGGAGRSEAVERNMFEFFGWVYHVGINSIGHEYCHLRFLFIRGRYIHMYKRDPHEHPGIKPIRSGVIGPTLMVEERGRRNINNRDLYELRFYNRLDHSKKGEIACATAGEARKWMEAFDHAKQQVEYELSNSGSTRDKLNAETEINLDGHRPRVRRYAHGLRKLIRIGQGPETLLRQPSKFATDFGFDGEGDGSDAIEPHEWKCVRTINGVRILEDLSNHKSGKGVLVKSVGVIDAVADTVFEVLLNLEKLQRYEWDMLTADLELVDSYDGHYDVVYGRYDPKYLSRWNSKQDFVFSRQWFRGQDGTYTILQLPATHKKKPPKSGYRRSKIIPSTWEIRNLNSPMGTNCPRCLVTHTLEIHTDGWTRWKNNTSSKFEKSIPYALLSQVSGLKEYIGANPALNHQPATTISGSVPLSIPDYDSDVQDEFYDAIAADSSSSDEEDEVDDNDDGNLDKKGAKLKLKNVSLAIRGLALKRAKASDTNNELDPGVSPIVLEFSQAYGSLHKGKDENDTNCWSSPSGTGFMIRGKSYLKDNSKVVGGDPLLKLVAVDWFKVDKAVDGIALNHNCFVQSDEGKRLPFILVVNLQVPAKPNYSLVLYYAANRPINKDSLLSKFVDGTDMFRQSRLKLIPSIVEGYWMVKRAVGTKACLLGKALTCRYLRQDNFLEIDVDIGSSSVARSVIGLVMGYVTSIVVDLALLIEGKEEAELPEYILGTVRLNRIRLDSAVPL